MSDSTKPQGAEQTGTEGTGFTPPASQDELNRIIAERLARERSKFADYDALRAKAEQFDAVQEAQKTEAQKQADALAAAQAELNTFKQREQINAWSKEITAGSHVPADLLRGSTQEELTAHFEQLKSLIPVPGQTPQAPAAPTFVGTAPAGTGNVPLKDQIAAAEKDGNWGLATELKLMQLGQSV